MEFTSGRTVSGWQAGFVGAAGLALALAGRDPAPGAPGAAVTLASAAWVVAGFEYERAESGERVRRAAEVAGRLDPTWSVPWVYGAMMARRLGAGADAEALLIAGMSIRPDDPTLPALLGAIRWADHQDAEGAARWVRRAAELPGVQPDPELIRRALEAE